MGERNYRLGPDIDLDREVVLDKGGQRITGEYAQQAAAEVLEKAGRGRPSLSGGATHSPHVSFRVPRQIRDQAEEVARQQGRRVSDVARQALEEYLARHQNAS